MERELEELLSRALDGVMSDDDAVRFDALLKENPAFRDEFLLLLRQERVARTLLDVEGGLSVVNQVKLKVAATASGEKFVERIHNEIDKKKRVNALDGKVIELPVRTQGPSAFGAARWIAGIAALVLLSVGLYFAVRPSPPSDVTVPTHPQHVPKSREKEVVEIKPPTLKNVASTFAAVPKGENGAPLGFWEFLPSAYYANTEQRFAVVLFFHGVDEGGDGKVASLQKVLKLGPPAILNNAAHPLHSIFEQNNVIVLAPQCRPSPEWWHAGDIGSFMDHVVARYGNRIDRRRIYLTGLSAGALGIHELMDRVPEKAHQAAGILVTASVGGAGSVGEPFAGPGVGAVVPYWALTSEGDNPGATIAGMNKMAGFIQGKSPTDLMKTYPGRDKTHTASFDPKTGWTWQPGVAASAGATLRLTLYSGSDHGSSTRTYDNAECWKWLFSQHSPAGNDPLEKF